MPAAQNRYLAQEGCWALPTETCERGCLLVAGPQAGSLMDARYDQLVILLLEHGPGGSAGIILNRPCNVLVENLLGWGWQPGGDSPSLEAAFSEERVYLGGFFPPGRLARQPITCLHGQVRLAYLTPAPLLTSSKQRGAEADAQICVPAAVGT